MRMVLRRIGWAFADSGSDDETLFVAIALAAVLQTKGISQDMAETLLARDETTDLAAACVAARKKRFGPWRKGDADPERQRKEIASLCRQGFSLQVARKVVEATDRDRLLSDCDEA